MPYCLLLFSFFEKKNLKGLPVLLYSTVLLSFIIYVILFNEEGSLLKKNSEAFLLQLSIFTKNISYTIAQLYDLFHPRNSFIITP